MLFYYGDATLDFNSATITANIPITKINQTTTISGQVMGRYFTTATGGPTGPVNTTYAPPGKPDMIIETSFIYDGWFSFMGMTDVEFTYRMADGTKIFGGPVKLSNAMFESSNRVFKVAVPVNSYYNAQTDYVGGSSVATATTAGIAALVWSKNPTWTRDQIINKMRQSATYYPTPNSSYGYGNVNAALAVQ